MNERQIATSIAKQLQDKGFVAVFAGGCVRDGFLGIKPKDYDIATNATPDQILALFSNDTVLPVGAQFGVIIIVREGIQVEVATFRSDSKYADGRRPDSVTFLTDPRYALELDASRRDLTINALFQDPISGGFFDFFNGIKDIHLRVLKTVGPASERFEEDRLRMLRAVRFSGKLDFDLDLPLFYAIQRHASDLNPGVNVSWERVASELQGILTCKNPIKALELLMSCNLMDEILPEIIALDDRHFGRQDPIYHPEGSVWTHTLMVLTELQKQDASFELMLGGLLHDIGKPQTMEITIKEGVERVSAHGHAEIGAEIANKICHRLKLSAHQIKQITDMVAMHMKMHSLNDKKMKRSKLVRLFERDDAMDLIKLQHADALGTHAIDREQKSLKSFYLEKWEEIKNDPTPTKRSHCGSLVDGHMIMAFGIKQGPMISRIKDAAFDAQMDGAFIDKEQAEDWLKSNLQSILEAPCC